VHTDEEGPLWVPAGHSTGADAGDTHREPAGHGVQDGEDVPTSGAKVPLGHGVGATDPTGQKLARGHVVHCSTKLRLVAEE
jgi:hypothetical protein